MTTTRSVLDHIIELDLSQCEVTVCLASASKDEILPRFERLLLSGELTDTFRSVAAFTLAHYKKGATEYDMFIAKLPSAMDAAILLPDWSKSLTGAKLVPSFGGYFGQDAGRPVFVFAKGIWIAGVAGLPEKEADTQARSLAGRLN